jgi:hypothetical protein
VLSAAAAACRARGGASISHAGLSAISRTVAAARGPVRAPGCAGSVARRASGGAGGWADVLVDEEELTASMLAGVSLADLASADDGDADADRIALSPAERQRRKRDRADKSPNPLGKTGLKGFVPSAHDRDKVRPTLDDVTRISRGERAKQRGVGSRATPHRLNADEREEYDRSLSRGWLTLQGRGYRKERKGSPLLNIWRQYSDARARAAIWVELGAAGGARSNADGSPLDATVVDLATLRHGPSAARAIAAAERAAAPYLAPGSAPELVGDAQGPEESTLLTQPIWNVAFHELRFEAKSRTDAKELAAELVRVIAAELEASAEAEPAADVAVKDD